MVVLLKLKAAIGYKYINIAAIKYFEACKADNTKTVIFFEDGTCLRVDVDSDIIFQEIIEIMEGFAFGEPEEEETQNGSNKTKH